MRKVRIIKTPGQALNKEIFNKNLHPDKLQKKNTRVKKYVEEVPDELANIEAEKGETFFGDYMGNGIPQLLKIGGKPHSKGGTKMAAPDGYVFSKYRPMTLKNPAILESFGVKKPMVPAEISKKFDFMDSLKGLYDPMSDPLQLKTYEYNVANAINKLGKLALTQEAFKGFPDGIPTVSIPYLEKMQMNPTMFIDNEQETPDNEPEQPEEGEAMARFGGQMSMGSNMPKFQGKKSMTEAARNKMMKKVGDIKPPLDLSKVKTPYEKQLEYMRSLLVTDNPNIDKDIENTKNAMTKIQSIYPEATSWYGHLTLDSDQRTYANLYSNLSRKVDRLERQKKYNKIKKQVDDQEQAELQNQKNWAIGTTNLYNQGKAYLQKMIDNKEDNSENFTTMVLSLRKLENYLPEKDPAINKGYDQFPVGYVPGDRMYFKYDPNTVSEISRLATIMNKASGNALVGKPAKKPAAPTPKPQVKTVVTDSSNVVTPQPQVESKTQSKKVVVPKKKVTTTTTIGYDESFDKYKMGGATSPLRKVRIIKHPSQTPMMERGGTIPKFQPGGNWAKKPDGTIYWKLRDGSEGKPPIEAIDDLKAKKKIDWSGPIYSIYEDKLKTDPKRKKNFDKMWSIFTDPKNKAMVDEFYNDYKNKSTAAGLPVLDEDKFLEVLKTGQMQTYALTDNKLDHDKWDSRTNRNKEYRKAMRELGYTPMDDATIKQFQTIYHTLQDISQQDKFKPVFGKFKLAPVSKDRNDMRGGLPVSKIDGIFGDTTANQTIMLLDEPEEIKEKEKEKEKEKDKEITEIQEKHFYDEPYYVPPAEEWLQDKMQRAYNIRGRSRAKKIEPTAYMPNLYLPTPTMYDPTREAAAIGEMASIGARQAAALGEPQQFAATYSGIQGRAARDIANAFGRYENMNVGVANQYENVRANLLNRWSGMRSSTLNDLAKQKAVADQQWINEQNMWDEKTTRDNIQAVTNAAQTDVMNSMYPQYAIDPSTGGFRPYFLRGRKMKPGSSRDEQDILRDIAEIRKSDKDMTYGEALKIYQMSHPEMNAQDIYMQNPHRYPQYSTGPYSGGTGYGPYQEDAEDENYYTT